MEIKMSALQIHTVTVSLKLNNKHLITGPVANSEFCFPRLDLGKHGGSRETKFTVPQRTSHYVICYKLYV